MRLITSSCSKRPANGWFCRTRNESLSDAVSLFPRLPSSFASGPASRGEIRQLERHPQCLVQFVDGALREGADEVGERRFGQAHELVAVNAAARWLRLRPRSRRFRVRHPVPGGRTSRRDTSSKAARRWRCSSPCWPIATSRRSVLLPDELPRGGRPQAPRWRRPGGAIVKRRAPNSIEKRERRASTPETGVGQFKPSLVGQIKASKSYGPATQCQAPCPTYLLGRLDLPGSESCSH